MGKALKIVVVTVTVVVALAAYVFYDNLPDYMDEPCKLRFLLFKMKVAFMLNMVGVPLGLGTSINMTRKAIDYVMFDNSYTELRAKDIQITDTVIDGVPVRIYKPTSAKGKLPGMVYFHGGGWVLGSVDAYNDVVVNQALESNLVGVSVDYRLAPEHPFPAGFEDCAAVTRHILRHGEKYGIDTSRVAVAGDSAGGNLAAAVAIKLRDERITPPLKAQVVVYGALAFCHNHYPIHEYRREIEKNDNNLQLIYFLQMWHNLTDGQSAAYSAHNFTSEFISRCEKYSSVDLLPSHFIQPGYKKFQYPKAVVTDDVRFVSERFSDTRVSPGLVVDPKGLPTAFVLTVGWDTLRDDGAIYARRLEQAGVEVEWLHLPDSFHGVFNGLYGKHMFRLGVKSHERVSAFLRQHL